MSVRQQAIWWAVVAAGFLALLWLLGGVLTPFVAGAAVAYFLDPVADRLERFGLSRVAATAVISVGATLVFLLAVLVVAPLVAAQLAGLVQVLPDYVAQARAFLSERLPRIAAQGGIGAEILDAVTATVKSRGIQLVQAALTSVMTLVNAVMFLVVVPVVAFYLLLDWDRMIAAVDELLPRAHADTIRDLARQIDARLAAFVRGQGSVCLILGSYYALGLMAVGLNFGLAIGAVAGLITFIPYVGAIVGGALAIGVALYQFWGDPLWIGVVAAVFALGQFLEGNVLTPRLVGGSVGLHPVWLLLVLSAFGALFGFVGMMVAVPVAAALGVIVRFLVARYRESALYRGAGTGRD